MVESLSLYIDTHSHTQFTYKTLTLNKHLKAQQQLRILRRLLIDRARYEGFLETDLLLRWGSMTMTVVVTVTICVMAQKPRYKRCLLGLVVKLLAFDAGEPGTNPGRSICKPTITPALPIHINT